MDNPQNAPQQPEQSPREPRSFGPMIGIVVIILVIVLAGLYFWGQRLVREDGDGTALPAVESTSTSTSQE